MKAKYYGHRDKKHVEIANGLRAMGFSVADTSGAAGFVDLVVATRNQTIIVEIKSTDGAFKVGSLLTIADWQGYAAITETLEETLNVCVYPAQNCLNRDQKDALRKLAAQMKAKKQKTVTLSVVRKIIEETK